MKTGVEITFLVWNRVRIWRMGRHTPPRIPRSTPPPPATANDLICYSPSDREATFLYIALTYIIVSSNASMSIKPKVNIKCLYKVTIVVFLCHIRPRNWWLISENQVRTEIRFLSLIWSVSFFNLHRRCYLRPFFTKTFLRSHSLKDIFALH